MSEELYIPKDCQNLKSITLPQIRLGIQGYPGMGKTWSALTAVNPIIIPFDGKLTPHVGRDIPIIPLHDDEYVNTVMKVPNKESGFDPDRPANKHIALLRFLKSEGSKFKPNQTLIIDGLSSLMDSFDVYWKYNPSYSKQGEVDKWAPHNAKIAYIAEMMGLLKGLKCHIILTTHESIEKDEEGRPTGKNLPLISGKSADKLAGYFTDWYRQHAIPKKDKKGNDIVLNGNYKLKDDVEYFWQVQKDDIAECCCSTGAERKQKFVRADFVKNFVDKKFELI